ncbi:hypothetical protein ACFYWX_08560 [Streptomyces sp. NPDC002888]|uniref:hypothetical protein n=1 Tax=Streptomyces sp. NPDC002888 TaxID=3364668 RepID=UPI003694270E
MIEQRSRSAPAPTQPHAPTTPVALLLGASTPTTTPALLEAWSSGITTHVLDRAALLTARTPDTATLADTSSGLDVTRPDVCVAWARRQAARGHRFDIVLGLRPDVQESAAATATALGLPGNRPEVIRTVLNPGACRTALAAAGFRVTPPTSENPHLAAVGILITGRPHVVLIATLPPDGPPRPTDLPHQTRTAVTTLTAAAITRLGLEFGLFRVDLTLTDRGPTLTSVHTTLGDDGVATLLTTTVPWLEPFATVYDDALNRSVPLPFLGETV